jgi:TonB-dependent starch-binding outer membrane protein SusC
MKNYSSEKFFYSTKQLLRKLRTTCVLVIVFAPSLFAANDSQVAKVNIALKDAPLSELIRTIENQTDYLFVYDKNGIDLDRQININAENQSVTEVLASILEGSNLEYGMVGTNIVLMPAKSVPQQEQAQSVSGRVTDSSGLPVPGVTVIIKGTNQGTITDFDGKYSLSNVPGDANLLFSFIGLKTQEVFVRNQTSIDLIMDQESIGIDEVVAIGYGTVRKQDLTGAVSNISSGTIMNQAKMKDPIQSLQGLVAGADITSGNAPGATSSIIIRGYNSLSASNAPLIIVDDAPFGGRLNEINPAEIEKIDILKDASSTAIYGARGANGVIIITTKRGRKDGKFSIEYDGYHGIGKSFRNFDMMNGEEYADYRRAAYLGVNNPTIFDDVQTRVLESGQYIDWQKLMFDGTSEQINHNVSINMPSEKSRNMIVLGYNKDQGLIDNMSYERFTGRFTSDLELSKDLTVGYSAMFARSETNYGDLSVWRFGTRMDPLSELYDEDGLMNFYTSGWMETFGHSNPIFDTKKENVDSRQLRNRFLGNLYTDWKITEDLKFKTSLTYDYSGIEQGAYFSPYSQNRRLAGNGANYSKPSENQITFTNVLNYSKQIGIDHKLDVSLVHDMQQYEWNSVGTAGFNMPYYGAWYNVNEAQLNITTQSGKNEWSILSFMGRANYSLKEKYLFTFTGRYDGSSRLAEGNKWDFFPSGAFAWRIKEEPFMNSVNFVSNLKLRMSYGITGNTAIATYATQGQFGRYPYNLGTAEASAIGYVPSLISNPNLGWEKTDELNLGLDYGFFNNRISGSVDIYQRNTYDLLMERNLPITSGYTSVWQNVGQTRNTGFELLLHTVPIAGNNFKWSNNLTLSYNKNEIVKLFNSTEDSPGNRWFIGEPLDVEHIYKYTGVWQTDEAEQAKLYSQIPGQGKYEDVNENNRYDAEDLFIYNKIPKWVGGFSSNFEYKNFDLGIYLYTRLDYGDRLGILTYDFGSTRFNHLKGNYWTPDNPTNVQPKPNPVSDGYLMASSFAFRDKSFVRLKNINFGYTLPTTVTSRIRSNSMRVYLAVDNPYLWTKDEYVGLDPENANSEGDARPLTTFMIGLNAKF